MGLYNNKEEEEEVVGEGEREEGEEGEEGKEEVVVERCCVVRGKRF